MRRKSQKGDGMASRTKKMVEEIKSETSCGNVFADLGLPNPEELLAKAELAIQIRRLIKQKKLTQKSAAELLEIDQPKISLLLAGKLSGFSLERLLRFLNKLGQSITITVETEAASEKTPHFVVTFPSHARESVAKRR